MSPKRRVVLDVSVLAAVVNSDEVERPYIQFPRTATTKRPGGPGPRFFLVSWLAVETVSE